MVLRWELRQRRGGWARSVWGTWYFMNFHVLWGCIIRSRTSGLQKSVAETKFLDSSLSFPFFPAYTTATLRAECPSVDMFCIFALFWNNTPEKRMLIEHINAELKPKQTCKLILGSPQSCVFQIRTILFQTAIPLGFRPVLPLVCYTSKSCHC